MSAKISYSSIENKYWPGFRDKINHCENTLEVLSLFSSTTASILNEIDDVLEVRNDEVSFVPTEQECLYSFSGRLKEGPRLKAYFDGSDIGSILDRFASAAKNRYVHLNKHPEKTNSKIKRH